MHPNERNQLVDAQILDWFTYTSAVVALGVGLTATDIVNVEADADFNLLKLSYFADLAGVAQTDATRVVPNVDIQILDTGSGRSLFFAPIPIPAIFGTGEIPYILPIRRLFKATSAIRVTFTSREVASTPTILLALGGYKDFGDVLDSRANRR